MSFLASSQVVRGPLISAHTVGLRASVMMRVPVRPGQNQVGGLVHEEAFDQLANAHGDDACRSVPKPHVGNPYNSDARSRKTHPVSHSFLTRR